VIGLRRKATPQEENEMVEKDENGYVLCAGPCDDFYNLGDGEIVNDKFYCFDCQDAEEDEEEATP
jgi:hypothetical protein